MNPSVSEESAARRSFRKTSLSPVPRWNGLSRRSPDDDNRSLGGDISSVDINEARMNQTISRLNAHRRYGS